MVDAWADDVRPWRESALLAWRRADVADLNRLARHPWDAMGRLHGPDVTMPGGRFYAACDRVVALAPNSAAGVVTSERFTVLAVRPEGMLVRADDDEREVVFVGEMLDAARLDHAYALTIHRSQGATYDRAHVLAAGGGRELAYVALSRARDGTTIHATADDLEQAIDDLHAAWGSERHQRWISDSDAQVGWDMDDTARERRLDAPDQQVHPAEPEVGGLADKHRLLAIDLETGVGTDVALPEGIYGEQLACMADERIFVAQAEVTQQGQVQSVQLFAHDARLTAPDWELLAEVPITKEQVTYGQLGCLLGTQELVLSLQASETELLTLSMANGRETAPRVTLPQGPSFPLGTSDGEAVLLTSEGSQQALWRHQRDSPWTKEAGVQLPQGSWPFLVEGTLYEGAPLRERLFLEGAKLREIPGWQPTAIEARDRPRDAPTTRDFVVPDATVEVEVLEGENLGRNFCTDLPDAASEPQSRQGAVAGEGTITLAPAPEGSDSFSCGTVAGELELTGLEADDGTTFAPIRVTSDSIGCYAG